MPVTVKTLSSSLSGDCLVRLCAHQRPITYPPGVLIATEPVQTDPAGGQPFRCGQISPQTARAFRPRCARSASEDLSLRSRGRARASRSGSGMGADVGPGRARPTQDQPERAFFLVSNIGTAANSEGGDCVSRHQSASHSLDNAVAAECKSLRTGELIHLSGLLVEATGPEIGTWRSSLSRTDTGNGACELVWVEELEQMTIASRCARVGMAASSADGPTACRR